MSAIELIFPSIAMSSSNLSACLSPVARFNVEDEPPTTEFIDICLKELSQISLNAFNPSETIIVTDANHIQSEYLLT